MNRDELDKRLQDLESGDAERVHAFMQMAVENEYVSRSLEGINASELVADLQSGEPRRHEGAIKKLDKIANRIRRSVDCAGWLEDLRSCDPDRINDVFSEIYSQFGDRLIGYAKRVAATKDHDEAVSLVGWGLTRLQKAAANLSYLEPGFIFGAVSNVCRNHRRKSLSSLRMLAFTDLAGKPFDGGIQSLDPEDGRTSSQQREVLANFLELLNPLGAKYRDVILHLYFHGRTRQETAEIMEHSVRCIFNYEKKAKEQLRNLLRAEDDRPPRIIG